MLSTDFGRVGRWRDLQPPMALSGLESCPVVWRDGESCVHYGSGRKMAHILPPGLSGERCGAASLVGEAGQAMHRVPHSEARGVAGPEAAQCEATGASQRILCRPDLTPRTQAPRESPTVNVHTILVLFVGKRV